MPSERRGKVCHHGDRFAMSVTCEIQYTSLEKSLRKRCTSITCLLTVFITRTRRPIVNQRIAGSFNPETIKTLSCQMPAISMIQKVLPADLNNCQWRNRDVNLRTHSHRLIVNLIQLGASPYHQTLSTVLISGCHQGVICCCCFTAGNILVYPI